MNKNSSFENTQNFLNTLSPKNIKNIYGDLEFNSLSGFNSISEILVEKFGDYILEFDTHDCTFFISSSACSLSFIYENKIYSEEEMIHLKGYHQDYYNNIDKLGMSYAPKNNMFGNGVITLYPASIVVLKNGNLKQITSWLDILKGKSKSFSFIKMRESIRDYFDTKKIYLLSSGGVDTALLINFLKCKDDIEYITYNFDRTGGNNTPNDAKKLLNLMIKDKPYVHKVYKEANIEPIKDKIYQQDVDLDLMNRLSLKNSNVLVLSGQNSDSIIAPGFIKSDSILSLFKNWGLLGGLKAIIINLLLVLFRWKIARFAIRFLSLILNLFLMVFSNKTFDYSARGFYIGLYNGPPFIYSKKIITRDILRSFKDIDNLFIGGIPDDHSGLVFLRIYSYSLYAMQNQRGVLKTGYKYVLPYHSSYFIGYSLNKRFALSDIWSPKKAMIDFLISDGLHKGFLFYGKDVINNDYGIK